MRTLLIPHPACSKGSVDRISVDAERRGDRLHLHFSLTGDLAMLLLPAPELPARGDRLWEHSCFEAFLRPGDGADYTEFNFAPSGRWAAYDFSGPRMDRLDAPIEPPRLGIWSDHRQLHLETVVSGIRGDGDWRVGLSAVVEEKGGALSYWALVHRSAKPDFHHPGSFILTLP